MEVHWVRLTVVDHASLAVQGREVTDGRDCSPTVSKEKRRQERGVGS
jgi:hypothetical protein